MNFLEEKILADGVIKPGDILKVDSFLNHQIDIVQQAGAEIVGIGIAIEKGQQKGGRELRAEGYQLESIAIIDSMNSESQTIHFREQ